MKKKSISLFGHNTSILLEEDFWQALQDIAQRQETTVRKIISDLDLPTTDAPNKARNLASRIRVYCLNYYRDHVLKLSGSLSQCGHSPQAEDRA